MTIGIQGFAQYTAFPLSQCVSSGRDGANDVNGKAKGRGKGWDKSGNEGKGKGRGDGESSGGRQNKDKGESSVAVAVGGEASSAAPVIIMHVHTFDQVPRILSSAVTVQYSTVQYCVL